MTGADSQSQSSWRNELGSVKWTMAALVLSAAGAVGIGAPATPAELTIAENGEARQAVVVSVEASDRTRAAAAELADYLGRMTGGEFQVKTGDGTRGIAVGRYDDFAELEPGADFHPEDPFRGDDYLLRTHADGAVLLGTGRTAVDLAVWDFLHRLGYRLFFLTDTWEVVPERPSLRVALDTMERPDYVTRRGPRGAPWSNRKLWQRWHKRNRTIGSFSLHTGHAYGGIVRANRKAFEAHPEYFALVNGERRSGGNAKFCIGNPGLRKRVVDYAVRRMKASPGGDSLSMDPSDGGGWCECDACRAIGSVSDRAITLANEVAAAINALGLGAKYVGIYGYNEHSPPPAIEVHPNVVVSLATAFIRGGHSIGSLVEGWRARGATLGIREYHDVFTWSHDKPRRARGGNLAYLARTIPYFHEQGARFMNSECADSWGANGLGYWITPRLLWDVDNAKRIDELVEDFLDNAFGAAKEPMRAFYHLLNRDHDSVRSTEDVVAHMYRPLAEARTLTDNPKVMARLDDLVLYTRYVELYYAYRESGGDARQAAFEQVWRHAYRMRGRMMLSTVAICHKGRAYRDKSVSVPREARWGVPEAKNPWKSSKAFDAAEIAAIVKAGVAANQPTVLDFEPVEYSKDLVPAGALDLPAVDAYERPDEFRGTHRVYTWLPADRKQLDVRVTGGLIKHYRDRGNVRLWLHADKEATLEAVAEDRSVSPEGRQHTVTLESPYDGLHRLQWTDGRDMTRIELPNNVPVTFRSTLQDRADLRGRWSLYFYVPKGTKVVGGYSTARSGRVRTAAGETVFVFGRMEQADYFSIPVPEGQDGTLWRFEDCTGARMLLTVPPYVAASVNDLLLPREVVEADAE